MKKYKNALISIGCYVITILLIYVIPSLTLRWSPEFASSPSILGKILLALAIISLFSGIFFGYKSIKEDANKLFGYVTALIGILILLFPLYGTQLIFLLD